MAIQVNTALLEDGAATGTDTPLPEGVYPEGQDLPGGRVLLFTVNGRQYTAPKNVDNRVIFRYFRAVREGREETGMADMLYGVLGEAVMDALAEEDLSDDEFEQVMQVIQKHVAGSAAAKMGKSRSASRR